MQFCSLKSVFVVRVKRCKKNPAHSLLLSNLFQAVIRSQYQLLQRIYCKYWRNLVLAFNHPQHTKCFGPKVNILHMKVHSSKAHWNKSSIKVKLWVVILTPHVYVYCMCRVLNNYIKYTFSINCKPHDSDTVVYYTVKNEPQEFNMKCIGPLTWIKWVTN